MSADLISVLIPERSRPAMLGRLIQSLLATAGDDRDIEILIAVDSDDPAYSEAVERPWHPYASGLVRVQAFQWERPLTLGDKLNRLAGEARGTLMFFLANDYIVETPDWPSIIRAAAARLPNRIGVLFPHDDLHPGHAAFPILTIETIRTVGFFMRPPYPYWFIDTDWDQVGILCGSRQEIAVTVRAPEGRGGSHALVDLPFWVEFFLALAPLRLKDAIQLMEAAHGKGAKFKALMDGLQERQKLCHERVRHLASPEFLRKWGAASDSPPSPRYHEVKEYAERMMTEISKEAPRKLKVAICVPSGRTWEGATANAVAALGAYTAMAGVSCAFINTQASSVAHNRNMSVELALREGVDLIFFLDSDMVVPPDALVRLLAHNKDIVGATYNKRTCNADGTYTTLGRLYGPKPAVMHDGLHEAELLPGGVLLVRADVYRRLGPPYYTEVWKSYGTDGLDGFKNYLRGALAEMPPDDALASLDGTAFGEWIRSHYEVGEVGVQSPYLSEDNFFIRRARRAGFTAWCDLRLTGDTIHLGTVEVDCRMPDDVVKQAPAVRMGSAGATKRGGVAWQSERELAAD